MATKRTNGKRNGGGRGGPQPKRSQGESRQRTRGKQASPKETQEAIEVTPHELEDAFGKPRGKQEVVAEEAPTTPQTETRGAWRGSKGSAFPLMLTGFSMSWLIANRVKGMRSKSSDGRAQRLLESTQSSITEATQGARQGLERTTHGARQSLARAKQVTREGARKIGRDARERGEKVTRGASHQLETHPLWVGAATIAAGAALGYAMPTSAVERQAFGPAAREVADTTRDVARSAFGKAKKVARPARDESKRATSAAGKSQGRKTASAASRRKGLTAASRAR